MSYVLVCDVVPSANEPCPVQHAHYEYYVFTMTAEDWSALWPSIILILFTAYGFRLVLRLIFNR